MGSQEDDNKGLQLSGRNTTYTDTTNPTTKTSGQFSFGWDDSDSSSSWRWLAVHERVQVSPPRIRKVRTRADRDVSRFRRTIANPGCLVASGVG